MKVDHGLKHEMLPEHMQVPMECWGSPEKVQAWVDNKI